MLKNKKISIVFLFVCIFLSSVFTTVSYALEFEAGVYLPDVFPKIVSFNTSSSLNNSYTFADVFNLSKAYYNDITNNASSFNLMKDSIISSGYNLWFGTSTTDYFLCYVWQDIYCDVAVKVSSSSSVTPFVTSKQGDFTYFYNLYSGRIYNANSENCLQMNSFTLSSPIYIYGSSAVKQFPSSGTRIWDGISYYYEPSIDTPDEPTLPTNQEIANAVQKFYDSDIYKNNTNFKDFVVVYSSLKNTYAFIGSDKKLHQNIFYNGYEYDGFSSSDTWWNFGFDKNVINYLFGLDFYLYFIEGDSDAITYEGVGSLYDLSEKRFSMNMTIVYSTYDYVVFEYRAASEGETEDHVTNGIVKGDSFTYDENVNPTDNQYSPLDNFVSSNSTQSILNDVDFDSINKAFEDSKVILNIENATWLFSANNQLVDYFVGFITFMIILLVISRVLGG